MVRAGCALLAALFLIPSSAVAQIVAAQPAGTSRVIVTLRDEVPLEAYAALFSTADARLQDRLRTGYHSRLVLGAIMALELRHNFRATAFFSRALKGFAATVTPAVAARLASDPMVRSIEPDNAIQVVPIGPAAVASSQVVDWGIGRIGADMDSTHSGDGSGTVSGVNVYVIDTGVDPAHPDINLVGHQNFVGDGKNFDCNGHGTGVSSIIAGRDNTTHTVGVAPGAPVTGVKVVNCQGISFPSIMIAGIDWVTAHAVKPAVANMSLGSLVNLPTVNTAVRNSAATGVFYAIAAGNGNPYVAGNPPLNACNTSPASAGYSANGVNGIMTVGATDLNDVEASFSNYGPCVDIWAPGVDVTAAWLTSEGGLITASGTSFSSPYVAGAAALLLSQVPTWPNWFVEYVIKVLADVPGTTSFDGAPIRRLQISAF